MILGFPANNFMGQEPGTNEEIKQFCSLKYNVTVPMFSKISVKGDDITPLYAWLTSRDTNPEFSGDIEWNFAKFLIGRDGTVKARRLPPPSRRNLPPSPARTNLSGSRRQTGGTAAPRGGTARFPPRRA